MKSAILTLLSLASMAVMAPAAHAYQPEHGYRYRTTYAQWDSGFSGYYSYGETCTRHYNGYSVYKTCYDETYFTPSTDVYVEELQMSGGYHRVRVFRDEAGTTPYVTYYVYEDEHVRRVERRDFEHDVIFVRPYESVTYVQEETVVWDQFHWDQGFEKVMVGSFTMGIGAIVVASSGGNPDVALLGLTSMALGSSSYIAGAMEMQQSSLEQYVVTTRYGTGMDVR